MRRTQLIRDMLTTFLKLALFPVFLKFFWCVECQLPKQPHIIFIFADDLGWNDVSFHGSQQIPTPNIDALANDGVILNNYYVQPLCTPSRAALMTGKYPIKLGLQHYVIPAYSPYGLSPNEMILPQYLKALGYATHGVGKWHLGFFENEYLPTNRGFDSFFGYWSGYEDYFTHLANENDIFGLDLHDNNNSSQWGYNGMYGTEMYTKKAVNIIENHDPQQPLFLYFPHQAVHVGRECDPFQAPQEYINKFSHIKDPERRIFAGMASAMDDSVGEVFSALDKAGMLNDTIIIFSSDNGGEVDALNATGSNFPLRGSKFTLWEGGVRGIAFVWSRFLRNVSKVSDELMHVTDWLPTLYSLAGGNPALLQDIDGFNQWPLLCCGESSKRNEILLNIDPEWNAEAIRRGKYKLIKGTCFNGSIDAWFNKEGKRYTYGSEFTEEEIIMHQQVYKESAQKSLVQSILLKNYGTKYFDHFCTPTLNINLDLKNTVKYVKTCNEENDNSEKSAGNCMCPVIVDCERNVFRGCNPELEACLFDVEQDPCEYNNIAAFEPEIVAELEGLLDYYRCKSAPLAIQPPDPSADPKYYGYAWVPWKSL